MAITDPTDIANCLAWWDAQAIVGLNDSDEVTDELHDLVASADFASNQGTPFYKTNIVNGHPAVLFDGSDDCLVSTLTFGAQPTSIALYVKYISGTEKSMCGSAAFTVVLGTSAADKWRCFSATALNSTVSVDTNVQSVIGIFNGASSTIRVSGVDTNGDAGVLPGTNFFRLGAHDTGVTSGAHANFYFLEGAIYTAAITSGNMDDLEAYFTAHWAAAGGVISPEHYYRNLLGGQSL